MDARLQHSLHLARTVLGLWVGFSCLIAFAGADPQWSLGIGFVVALVLTMMYGYLSLDRFLSDAEVLARIDAH